MAWSELHLGWRAVPGIKRLFPVEPVGRRGQSPALDLVLRLCGPGLRPGLPKWWMVRFGDTEPTSRATSSRRFAGGSRTRGNGRTEGRRSRHAGRPGQLSRSAVTPSTYGVLGARCGGCSMSSGPRCEKSRWASTRNDEHLAGGAPTAPQNALRRSRLGNLRVFVERAGAVRKKGL